MVARLLLNSDLPISAADNSNLAGFHTQNPQLTRSQEWLNSITPWLKEHAQATGQILRIQVTQVKKSGKDSALNALVSLPLLNSDRKNTCVVLHEIESASTQTLKTGSTELECGLGLNGVLESKTIQQALNSLSHTKLQIREWEARFVWLTLELLDLLESPVSALPSELRAGGADAGELNRFVARWRDFHTARKTHDLGAAFDPDAVLDEEGLYPDGGRGSLSDRTARTIPDAAAAFLMGGVILGLGWAANIARSPAYRCTSSGLFRLKLRDRLADRARYGLSRILNKKASKAGNEPYVLKG
jgi:hypothetical protein